MRNDAWDQNPLYRRSLYGPKWPCKVPCPHALSFQSYEFSNVAEYGRPF